MKRPSLRAVTRMVRETHEAWSHPDAGSEMATLEYWEPGGEVIGHWRIAVDQYNDYYVPLHSAHSEYLGSGKIDAVAIARRLIAGLPKG